MSMPVKLGVQAHERNLNSIVSLCTQDEGRIQIRTYGAEKLVTTLTDWRAATSSCPETYINASAPLISGINLRKAT